MGRELGYDFEECGDDCLSTTFLYDDGRKQTVRMSLQRRSSGGPPYIRFWSPALDLSATKKTGKSAWPTAALKKLTKPFLIDLLERNAHPGLKCRFAISRDQQAVIVLVDQLVGSLDEQEFRQHVEHVARVADSFEKERGEDLF